MARGKTLNQLVEQLRAEAGYNTSPATGVGSLAMLQQALRRAQEELYDEVAWPFFNARRDKTLAVGQRYYDFPSDLPFQNVADVRTLFADSWLPVTFGITMDHYSIHDSDDSDDRADPVQRWNVIDTGSGEQIEVWPIPATAGTLRLHGRRTLAALIANDDTADLDDILIVLRAAASVLAERAPTRAQEKLAGATARLNTLRQRMIRSGSEPVVPGGAADAGHRRPTEIRIAR